MLAHYPAFIIWKEYISDCLIAMFRAMYYIQETILRICSSQNEKGIVKLNLSSLSSMGIVQLLNLMCMIVIKSQHKSSRVL